MPKHLIILLVVLLFGSCKKKSIKSSYIDYSIAEDVQLNKMVSIGNKLIIVGGERFYKARMYSFEKNLVSPIPLPTTITNKEIYGIDISSNGGLLAVGYDASIYTSNDSGFSWNFIQDQSWKEFQSIAFRDVDSAFIVGGYGFEKGILVRTNKEGASDVQLRQEQNFELTDIQFVTSSTGYCAGYGAILKTIDGGQNWNYTSAKNDFYKAMSWKNTTEGVAVGFNGSIIKTTDGGDTWNTIRNGNQFLKKKCRFLDIAYNQQSVYAATGEKGCIVISKDDGETWLELEPFTKNDLRGVCLKNQNTIVVVGTHGTIAEVDIP
jgi:photosystem II stability/assembly factor-like uncharacterized protein